jgi:hypothetical protein
MMIQILISNGAGGSTTFVWEPQKAFSSAPQNVDQSFNLSLKGYPESFKLIYQETSIKILKKPKGLNLRLKFVTETFS